jgi:hypothetical protein
MRWNQALVKDCQHYEMNIIVLNLVKKLFHNFYLHCCYFPTQKPVNVEKTALDTFFQNSICKYQLLVDENKKSSVCQRLSPFQLIITVSPTLPVLVFSTLVWPAG